MAAVTTLADMASTVSNLVSSLTGRFTGLSEAINKATDSLYKFLNPFTALRGAVKLVQNLSQKMRDYTEQIFLASAAAVAEHFREALWDVRAEVGDLYRYWESMAIKLQAELIVDDDQVREVMQELATVNMPVESAREWLKVSLLVSRTMGISAQELGKMAADLNTFGVSARAAERAFGGIAVLARKGYMSLSEAKEVLQDAVDLMGRFANFGDQAFLGISKALASLRETMNNMGVPQFEEAYTKLRDLLSEMLDFTSETGQQALAALAGQIGTDMRSFARMIVEEPQEALERILQAHASALEGILRTYGGVTALVADPRKIGLIAQQLETIYHIPENLTKRVLGDVIARYRELTKAGMDSTQAAREATKVLTEMHDAYRENLRLMEQQGELQKMWQDFKSQITVLTSAFKELGHTFMVSIGRPMLWFASTFLKIVLAPIKTVLNALIELNERFYGLTTAIGAFLAAYIMLRPFFVSGWISDLAEGLFMVGKGAEKAKEATGWLSKSIASLRQKSKVFDFLAGKVEVLAGRFKTAWDAFILGAKETIKESSFLQKAYGRLGEKYDKLSVSLYEASGGMIAFGKAAREADKKTMSMVAKAKEGVRKSTGLIAKSLKWTQTFFYSIETAAMDAFYSILKGTSKLAVYTAAVLSNAWVWIAGGLVMALAYYKRHEKEILQWLEDLPQKVHDFLTKSLVPTMQDVSVLVPKFVGAMVKLLADAIAALPLIVRNLIPALAEALVLSAKEAAKAFLESLKDNLLGTVVLGVIGYGMAKGILRSFGISLLSLQSKYLGPVLKLLPVQVTEAFGKGLTTARGHILKFITDLSTKFPLLQKLVQQATYALAPLTAGTKALVNQLASIDWKKALKTGDVSIVFKGFWESFKAFYGEFSKVLKTRLGKLKEIILKTRLGQAFADALKAETVKQQIVNVFTVFKEEIKKGFNKVKQAIMKTQLGQAVVTALSSMLTSLVGYFTTTILPALSSLMAQLVAMINPVTAIAAAVLIGVSLIYKYRDKVWAALKKVGEAVFEGLKAVVKGIYAVIKTTIGAVLEFLVALPVLVAKAVLAIPYYLSKAIVKALAVTISAVAEFTWAVAKWSPLGLLIRGWILAFDLARKAVGYLAESFSDAFSKIWSVVKWTPLGIILQAWIKGFSLLKQAVSWLSDTFTEKFKIIGEIIDWVTDKVEKLAKALAAPLKALGWLKKKLFGEKREEEKKAAAPALTPQAVLAAAQKQGALNVQTGLVGATPLPPPPPPTVVPTAPTAPAPAPVLGRLGFRPVPGPTPAPAPVSSVAEFTPLVKETDLLAEAFRNLRKELTGLPAATAAAPGSAKQLPVPSFDTAELQKLPVPIFDTLKEKLAAGLQWLGERLPIPSFDWVKEKLTASLQWLGEKLPVPSFDTLQERLTAELQWLGEKLPIPSFDTIKEKLAAGLQWLGAKLPIPSFDWVKEKLISGLQWLGAKLPIPSFDWVKEKLAAGLQWLGEKLPVPSFDMLKAQLGIRQIELPKLEAPMITRLATPVQAAVAGITPPRLVRAEIAALEPATRRRPRAIPTPILQPPTEEALMSDLVANTDLMVTLLRKIEANTRKSAGIAITEEKPNARHTSPIPGPLSSKLANLGHI